MTKNILDQVESHLAAGERDAAQSLLKQYLQQYPRDDQAWVLLAHAVDSNTQMVFCLTQARKINPQNAQAQTLLKVLKGAELKVEEPPGVEPEIADRGETGPHPVPVESETADEDPNAVIDPQVTARIDELFEGIRGGVEPSSPYGRPAESGQELRWKPAPDASSWIDEQNMADLRFAPLDLLWHWECDAEGKYTSCSSEVELALGIQPDDFLGQELHSFSLGEKSRLAVTYHLQADIMPVEVPVHYLNTARQLVPVSLHIDKTVQDGLTVGYHGVARIIRQAGEAQPPVGEAKEEQFHQDIAICPFLDAVDASGESSKSTENDFQCSRPKQALPVSAVYQRAYCSSTAYTRCQVYRQGVRWPKPSVINLKALESSRQRRQWFFLILIGLVMILAIIVLSALILTTV